MNVEATAFEVEVFNSEIERLTHPQAAGVDQMDNQAGGIAVKIGHVGQELEHLLAVWTMTQTGWAFGAESVNISKLLFEGVAVKEKQRVECLVLRGDGHALESETGKDASIFSSVVTGDGAFGHLRKEA